MNSYHLLPRNLLVAELDRCEFEYFCRTSEKNLFAFAVFINATLGKQCVQNSHV